MRSGSASRAAAGMKPIFRPIAWMTSTGSAGAEPGVLLVGLADVVGVVAGDRAVAGRVVEQRELGVAQVVVDRLGHAGGHQVEPALVRELAHLVGRVLRVVAADVEEVADVVGPEDVDDALEVLVLAFLELVPAGADAAGRRRGAQEGDLLLGCRREVEQFFLEDALDAEVSGVDGAERSRDARRQVSTIPRSELLMTQVGPPDWATTTLRAAMVRSILSRSKSAVYRPGSALLGGAMGDQAAINYRISPGRFLLDCSTRQRIKASPERPVPLRSRLRSIDSPRGRQQDGSPNGSNGVPGIGRQHALSVQPTRSPETLTPWRP